MKIVALEIKNIGADVDLSKYNDLGDFVQYDLTSVDQIEERAGDADVLIINKLPINESTIGNFKNLKLVCITATGFDNVDVKYCNSMGIEVCNVKGYSTSSVVQHTFASLFYIYEKLNYYDAYVKSGEYAKCNIFTHIDEVFYELEGKTWGVVGLGNIGRGVANVAKAFGCKVIYYSTSGKNSNSDFERVDFDALLSESDIISIHSPLTDATRNLFSTEAFKKMKSSAYLVNVGRGPIVDEAALVKALNDNEIAGAALDVVSKEPISADNPLLAIKDSKKLLITPHIAWASLEARTRLMDEVYLNIKAFMNNEKRNNIVL